VSAIYWSAGILPASAPSGAPASCRQAHRLERRHLAGKRTVWSAGILPARVLSLNKFVRSARLEGPAGITTRRQDAGAPVKQESLVSDSATFLSPQGYTMYILPVMITLFRPGSRACWCFCAWLLLANPIAQAQTNSLVWDSRQQRVDAQIESWDLPALLQQISSATGWRIYVEPGTRQITSVRFKNLAVGEALKRLLGDLNFALLPQTNSPAKLFIYRTSLQEATQLVLEEPIGPADRQGPIPNELLITLRPGAKESIEELAARYGATILGRADGLNTFRLGFEDETAAQAARARLDRENDVAGTDLNYHVDRPTRVDNLDLGSAAPFPLRPKLGNPSDQVIVGLIDTAVQKLDPAMNGFLLPQINVGGEASLPHDQLTHGTSMAATILRGLTLGPEEGGGSSVRVLPVDVYGNNPETTTFDLGRGIYAALGAGATIINLSLGGEGDSRFLANLIQDAHHQGVIFIGAAGNQPTGLPTFPAAYRSVVAVTAGDKMGNIAPYANFGNFVDVIAPGVSLVQFEGQSYLVRGTSAAAAYVSGAAASYRAAGSSSMEVEARLRQAAPAPQPSGTP
jgi:hypothetical protein